VDAPAETAVPPAEAAPSPPAGLPEVTTVIHFPYNSNQVDDDAARALRQFAAMVKNRPGTRLVITGYTDGLGDNAHNLTVSKFRADAIESDFIGQGISADRITAIGPGPVHPLAPDDTFHGRSRNRRVEVEIRPAD
jgi:outer membrane protein OmpA-like peptidoglycan-associated protein